MGGAERPRIVVVENGPYRVVGAPIRRMRPILSEQNEKIDWELGRALSHEDEYELCRCGSSATKPFCDGSEEQIGFDGTETADRAPTGDRRAAYGDPPVFLTDDIRLCSKAGFCVRRTADVWDLAEEHGDPERLALLRGMVARCPSGRLVLHGPPRGDPIEEDLPQEIAAVDHGPLWVRGGIPVEGADGVEYEVRNRATLCRCGASKNKPFCDGSHARIGFTDP